MPNESDIVFSAKNLTCTFGFGKKAFNAVDSVDFDIYSDEIISLVGESGSGKTTLARMLLALQHVSSGTLLFEGKEIQDRIEHWKKVQAVFQDPFASFNQFFTIKHQLADSYKLFEKKPAAEKMRDEIDSALGMVNITTDEMDGKYPFELSGGQMQRLLIARVFLIKPKVLFADEPTSMIDACSRASILDYLLELKKKLKMSIIFITHDIGLANYVSDRVFIMNTGKIVEKGGPEKIIRNPDHDYTRKLLDDIPKLYSPWLSREKQGEEA